jgi:hypothetical protein
VQAGQQEAFGRLEQEIDILNFIEASRLLRLLTSVLLRPNQRQLVKYFKNYHLDLDNLELPKKVPNETLQHLMKRFNPTDDPIDKRILYEITGRKGQNDRFSDEEGSSSDEDNQDKQSLGDRYGSNMRNGLIRTGGDEEESKKTYTLND